MFCKNCGQQIDDNAAFCPYCGAASTNTNNGNPAGANNANNGYAAADMSRGVHGIALAAKVFIIIGMVFGFWTILPLIFGGIALSKMKVGKPSAGISVCVLLFCNIIGGILLLCSDERDYF